MFFLSVTEFIYYDQLDEGWCEAILIGDWGFLKLSRSHLLNYVKSVCHFMVLLSLHSKHSRTRRMESGLCEGVFSIWAA